MNNLRLSLDTRDSVRDWITFLRELYDEVVQDEELLKILDRLIYERREPSEREIILVNNIIRDAYVAENGSSVVIANLENNYNVVSIIYAINKLIPIGPIEPE